MGPFAHLSVGFAARSRAARIPLPVLLVAAYLIEIVYFAAAALGLDTPAWAPWSHSLLLAALWSLAAGGLYALIRRRPTDGAVVAGVAFSHWLLDFIAWNNLPATPWSAGDLGLGLYARLGFDLAAAGTDLSTLWVTLLDLGLFGIGIALWRAGRPRAPSAVPDRRG
jgi:hypothetical protein